MFGWPVIGLTSDRVGAATWRAPFYTIRIDAVWPSSEGAEKVIIWPIPPFRDSSRAIILIAIGLLKQRISRCNVCAYVDSAGGRLVCLVALVFVGLWVCGLALRARVGWAEGSVISFLMAARHDVFRSRFVGSGRFAGR
jgi:hypothetical protein